MTQPRRSLLRRWVSSWLDRHGLGSVANVIDQTDAQAGNVEVLHAVARRAIAAQDFAAARSALERALALAPQDGTLYCSLGAVQRHEGDFAGARLSYEAALARKPDYVQALSNLGELSLATQQPEEAIALLERALALAPHFFEARVNLGAALSEAGHLERARAVAQSLVDDEPQSAEAHLNLGNVLVHSGKGRMGVRAFRKALDLRPGYPEAHFNLATFLGSRDDLVLAIGFLERKVREQGDSVQNLAMLASAKQAGGHMAEAEVLCKKILERQSDNSVALITLASCMSARGDVRGAIDLYARVVAADPSQAAVASNIAFETTNLDGMDREAVFRAHTGWARQYTESVAPIDRGYTPDRDPRRKLRIGYISGDFVLHPVGFLLREILACHDREHFEVYCYSMVVRPEDVLPEIKAAAHVWEEVFLLSDDELATLIASHRIDIMVDLSGHTAYHRLLALARRPAPVQVEWIGYFHSTGMTAIDYFITDPTTTPPDGGQRFTEIPVYLPNSRFCYGAPAHAPDVAPVPCLRNGHITFGSFNRLPKVTESIVAAWSRILHGVPGSRMVLKSLALSEADTRERVWARFADYGITAARVDLREVSGHTAMLAEYGDIDIALDTCPFNGGMTTLEALWMGVPVVTVAGNTVVSRQTVSVLANIALDAELAFADLDTYVAGAVALAANPERLRALRADLRPRMQASPLRDAPQFTRDLEALYRRMWMAWCNGNRLEDATSARESASSGPP